MSTLVEIGVLYAATVPLTITAITRSGTTATATTSVEHGFNAGDVRTVAGVDQAAYNGAVTILSVPTPTTFTYTVAGSPTTPATGTMTVTRRVFRDFKPPTPDNVVWLMDYGGLADETTIGSGAVSYEQPRIQVGCRAGANDSDTPKAMAQLLRIASMAVMNQLLSGTSYKSIDVVTPPFFLQRDENNRVEIVMNIQPMKALSA